MKIFYFLVRFQSVFEQEALRFCSAPPQTSHNIQHNTDLPPAGKGFESRLQKHLNISELKYISVLDTVQPSRAPEAQTITSKPVCYNSNEYKY